MVSSKNFGFLDVLYFVYLFQPSHTIQVCPERAVLERYSTTKCSNRRIYHCLVEDSNGFNNYREECRTPEWVSLGNYPVFRGKYIDYETCPADSYQPFLSRSNEHYKCAYLKSKCSSEGQVYVTGGNTTIDTACRCDYNKGFAFVIRPRNQCACVPSKDDCSCYIKHCSEGETLNPDYQCTLNNQVLPGNSSCPVLIVTATTDLNIDTALNSTVFNNLVTPKRIIDRTVLGLPVVIVILLLTTFITYVTCLSKAEEKENQPSKGNENSSLTPIESAVTIMQPSVLTETQTFNKEGNSVYIPSEKAENTPFKETVKRMSATKEIAVTIMQPSVLTETQTVNKEGYSVSIPSEKAENTPLKETDKRMSASKEIADNSPLLETENRTAISKEKAEDQPSKIKENSILTPRENAENQPFKEKDYYLTPRENADIVILHTKDENQKQEVADFKSLLEGISYCGIRYHLFEELFPTEKYNSGIDIQTVLRKCNFIFVYISKDYVSSKLKRFGLKESSINDALEATETRTKIKKLSNCERWIMPADKQLSPPDFDFNNFDYRSKDSISKYQKFLGGLLSNV